MLIKVRRRVYDGNKEPIMVILTPKDKENIANMDPKATKYAQFPDDKFTEEEIRNWMSEV